MIVIHVGHVKRTKFWFGQNLKQVIGLPFPPSKMLVQRSISSNKCMCKCQFSCGSLVIH